MSRKCCEVKEYKGGFFGGYVDNNCCCNFPALIILILIVLQFSKNKDNHGHGKDGVVGNGVLFIIALFFLSCCNPCNRR